MHALFYHVRREGGRGGLPWAPNQKRTLRAREVLHIISFNINIQRGSLSAVADFKGASHFASNEIKSKMLQKYIHDR